MNHGNDSRRRQAALIVCETFVATAPVDGAAFTEMASDMVRNTWCSSDLAIAEIERVQYSLGEGPTQDAFDTLRPVLVPDLTDQGIAARWPMFVNQIVDVEVGALFAIPMRVGAITAGVCTSYRREPGLLNIADLQELLRAVDAATLALLAVRTGTAQVGEDGSSSFDASLPRVVHQATGMVVAQLGVSVESAFARLRAHAYLTGRSVHEVSEDIVERRLRLEADPPEPIQLG